MKKLVYTIITILFLSPISAQILSTTIAKSEGKVKNEPTILADIIATVSKGDTINIMGYEEGYWKIQKDTVSGYMSELFLDINEEMRKVQKDAEYFVNVEKQVEKETKIQQLEVPIYKLFPTENTWASLKLNTRNGKIWQVHFSISKDGYQGELSLNSYSLVQPEEEINGRFNLYPTDNMFNFILLDQVNGNTYQVQWNNDYDKRFITRIY